MILREIEAMIGVILVKYHLNNIFYTDFTMFIADSERKQDKESRRKDY